MTATGPEQARPSRQSLQALDYLNFFLADVRDGIGPYLAVFLKASHNWNAADIGIAISASTIASVIAQTPSGALIDRLRQKRLLIAFAASFVCIGCLGIVFSPTFPVVISAQALIGIAAGIFPPAIAAISLGLVGHSKLDGRIGRNETFNHAGNLLTAAVVGLIAKFVANEGIFFVATAVAIASAIAALSIREQDIDHNVARGAINVKDGDRVQPHISNLRELLSDRRIANFALSVVLFQFANAGMIVLIGEKLSEGRERSAALYISACIIVAQLVMVPVANLAGRLARFGRKPVFLVGFAVLPIRAVLFTLSNDPVFLVSVQILDGVGAGIFGVMTILIAADLTQGTGRFNITQGGIQTGIGIGAALSNILAGFVVGIAGYNAGFLTLAVISLVAVAVFWFAVPETKAGYNS